MTAIHLVGDHAIMREGLRAVLHVEGRRVAGESVVPTKALSVL